ncbi:class I SAM-dependent methyltransferase [Pseudonocardia sp. KRD-184]|uniref:Class I SAM-dependent methyltransferase n=1 Tax=Pseudonocardia oceani TaxID=2792013 RepID=A0ABS6UFY8_9PSEU|nr:class I SAM-dependent methyltransferase [Pseudonocardia oceani]MBW0090504.1 class I SAM-dependent methyltransferase [Pseudonocardia oceani]MBW0098543.1 class I SAM-dependent methyltransferase [Pseudonocardia oceani]MBW0124383.1 class I SAM-dependent methyltransferase [Pseudonocardia oceani]MBW0131153.1 class I SAM-dependent methyltransferase [Pseudonocardia oceani]MBW0132585.1 class I SAM-dependent methyltransferase [Pseudonocardia oceani]
MPKSNELTHRITYALNNPYSTRSIGGRARQKRWGKLLDTFPDLDRMRVLDLGGTVEFWQSAPAQPKDLTVVNLEPARDGQVHGDACAPPAEIRAGSYDIVISNSLIEHVGGHLRRQALAEVIADRAPRHWVQTPYRYFPVEPHWMFPGMQFLPFRARLAITQHWPLGHYWTDDPALAMERTHEVELVSATEMRSYFPDSDIWFERMAGLPKSLVAIRA